MPDPEINGKRDEIISGSPITIGLVGILLSHNGDRDNNHGDDGFRDVEGTVTKKAPHDVDTSVTRESKVVVTVIGHQFGPKFVLMLRMAGAFVGSAFYLVHHALLVPSSKIVEGAVLVSSAAVELALTKLPQSAHTTTEIAKDYCKMILNLCDELRRGIGVVQIKARVVSEMNWGDELKRKVSPSKLNVSNDIPQESPPKSTTDLNRRKMKGIIDRHFKIKTDHFSFKYLLDQRMYTPTQLKWLPKLMGFDYEIQYKKGLENVTVDALSRIQHSGELFITTGKTVKGSYTWANQELKRKGKLVVGDDQVLRTDLLKQFHEGSVGVHSRDLQPLPIHATIWSSISMDFVEGLPKSKTRQDSDLYGS
ncbi:hypothetical protein Tco_1540263 [Tanacetum coccineum]